MKDKDIELVKTLIQEEILLSKGDVPVRFDCPSCGHLTLAIKVRENGLYLYYTPPENDRKCLTCGKIFHPITNTKWKEVEK